MSDVASIIPDFPEQRLLTAVAFRGLAEVPEFERFANFTNQRTAAPMRMT